LEKFMREPFASGRSSGNTLWLLGLLAAALLLAIAPTTAALADALVVSTGNEGGSYYYIGRRLRTELLLVNELPATIRTSRGSLDNLAQLGDPNSDVNLGLTQADALLSYLGQHADFAKKFFVLGDMGKECAFVITRTQGGLAGMADLKRTGAGDFALDSPESGAAVTFSTMRALDPAFEAANPVFRPVMEALLQLKQSAQFTQLRAVMLVQRPRRVSPPMRTAITAPESYRFLPITQGDVPNAKLPDGSAVYSYETVTAGRSGSTHGPELETICTRALLLGSTQKLSHEQRGKLSAFMLEAGERIAGKDE
jgi:hypothetical protein